MPFKNSRFYILALAFLIWSSLAHGQAISSSAKIQGFIITSDSLSRDLENDTVALSGNVKIIYQNQFIEAEKVDIDFKSKRAYLEGSVRVQTPQYLIGGKRVILDYESNQGIIYVGFVQSNNIRFQGDMIEKINDTDFYVSNADYTSCTNCPATWSFEGQKIRAELGGYAYIKNSFLKVGSVPVFWLPYLIVPLKSERQTGLLTPKFGSITKRNLFFSQDFFWAISRNEDATFTLKNYELGGPKLLLEYRYVLDEYSNGWFKSAYMRDSVFASEDRFLNYVPADKKSNRFNRYYLETYNQYKWQENNRLQLRSTLVSDLQYPKDFTDEIPDYADSSLETRLTYGHTFKESLFQADASLYRNLLQADPLAGREHSVDRLPELRYESTLKPFFNTPFYYRVDSSWTRFHRPKYYDDMTITADGQKYATNTDNDPACEKNGSANCQALQDGVYDPANDLIRTGQRFFFKTSLTTQAYKLGDIALLTPTVSYSEAQYYFHDLEDKFSARRYLQFELNTRTKFYRVLDPDPEEPNLRYKNEIIPELQYSYIPWVYTEKHPFFGNQNGVEPAYTPRSTLSDKDVNTPGGLLFDYEDKVYDRHIISFSLLDRFIRKKLDDNSYKTLMSFRVTQSYDLYQSQFGEKKDQPLSSLSATLNVDLDQIQSYSQADYYPYNSATDTTTWLSYLNEQQQYFRIGYSSKRIETKQDDVSLAIGFVTKYVNVLSGIIFDASADRDSSSRLKKLSLITQLKPPGECWAVNFYRDQKVGGETEWSVTFDFSFDGKPTKVIPPAELNLN